MTVFTGETAEAPGTGACSSDFTTAVFAGETAGDTGAGTVATFASGAAVATGFFAGAETTGAE
jgi:hypothetical protein